MNARTIGGKRGILVLVLGVLLPLVAEAEEPRGIAVNAVGEVEVKPSVLVIRTTVKGEAELASDALKKYEENKRRAIEAFGKLEIEGLTVSGEGSSIANAAVNPQMAGVFIQGQPQANPDPRFLVSERLVISVEGIDEMEDEALWQVVVRILDEAKDLGLGLGAPMMNNPWQIQAQGVNPNTLARFKIAQEKEARAQSYQKAIAEARLAAQRLADLAGVKLGRVLSIKDLGEVDRSPATQTNIYLGTLTSTPSPRLIRPELAPIPIRVQIAVIFEIVQ